MPHRGCRPYRAAYRAGLCRGRRLLEGRDCPQTPPHARCAKVSPRTPMPLVSKPRTSKMRSAAGSCHVPALRPAHTPTASVGGAWPRLRGGRLRARSGPPRHRQHCRIAGGWSAGSPSGGHRTVQAAQHALQRGAQRVEPWAGNGERGTGKAATGVGRGRGSQYQACQAADSPNEVALEDVTRSGGWERREIEGGPHPQVAPRSSGRATAGTCLGNVYPITPPPNPDNRRGWAPGRKERSGRGR